METALGLLMFLAGVMTGMWATRGESRSSRELADRSSIWQEHSSRVESMVRESSERVTKMDETLFDLMQATRGVIRAVVPRELRDSIPGATGTQSPPPPPPQWESAETSAKDPRATNSRRASLPAQS